MMNKKKKILIIIGGGISAYKSLDLIRFLKKTDLKSKLFLTKSGNNLSLHYQFFIIWGKTL